MLWHKPLHKYSLFHSLHQLQPRILQQLLWVGGPIGLAAVLEYGLYATVSFFMGALGTPVLAAHQVVSQTIIVLFMVPLAMSYAATVRVGQWLGQRDWKQIQQAAFVSIGLAVSFMFLTGIALFTYPRQIVGLYLDLNDSS